jgi:hypothetical protein
MSTSRSATTDDGAGRVSASQTSTNRAEFALARETGRPLRLHARDGEVMVVRVLDVGEDSLRFAVLTSSRPERYATCDSTGVVRAFDEIERAVLLDANWQRGKKRR